MKNSVIRGRSIVFGDNIDTDIIAPPETISFGLADEAEFEDIKKNAFRVVRPNFWTTVKAGDILVAGRNFGLGSHREGANRVLVTLGFQAAIVEFVARLFFRNSVAIGFPIFEVPGILGLISEGEDVEIDLQASRVKNVTRGGELPLGKFSPLIATILEQGGILELLKRRLNLSA